MHSTLLVSRGSMTRDGLESMMQGPISVHLKGSSSLRLFGRDVQMSKNNQILLMLLLHRPSPEENKAIYTFFLTTGYMHYVYIYIYEYEKSKLVQNCGLLSILYHINIYISIMFIYIYI